MVKLDLTSLQNTEDNTISSENTSTINDTPSQIIPETSNSEQESAFSFSLSSLIWNKETSAWLEWNIVVPTEELSTPIIQEDVVSAERADIELPTNISQTEEVNQSEQTLSIFDNSEESSTITSQVEEAPVIEEKKEFFKNFDIIKEFSEEKWEELIIWKWEEKKVEETVKTDDWTSILWEWKTDIIVEELASEINTTQEPVVEEVIVSDQIITENNIVSEESNESVSVQTENVNIAPDVEVLQQPVVEEIKNQASIEQVKKDLSSARKPFWIKSFNKKNVITSIWALFLVWILTFFWLNQIIWGGKVNVQEIHKPIIDTSKNWTEWKPVVENNEPLPINSTNNIEENSWASLWDNTNEVPVTLDNSWETSINESTKYVEWTDYVVIKNTRKNIKMTTSNIWANESSQNQYESWIINTDNISDAEPSVNTIDTNPTDEMDKIANEAQ